MSLRHRPHRILYVPADSRPSSVQWPRLLCRMVDWELIMPPVQLLGWFAEPGNPEEIMGWASEAAQGPFDGVVISLDMLAYGGLEASLRPYTRTELALRRLDFLAQLRRLVGSVPMLGFASIPGLTAHTRSDDIGRYLDALAEYAAAGEWLECSQTDGPAECTAESEAAGAPPAAVVGEYLAIRRRDEEVNHRAIEEVCRGNLDYLVLAQGPAAPQGVHRAEQQRLAHEASSRGVEAQVMITSGGSEMGMLLIARAIHAHMAKVPSARALWSVPEGAQRIPDSEDRTVARQFRETIEVLGGRVATQDGTDLTVVVNCPLPADRHAVDLPPSHEQRLQVLETALEQGHSLAAGRGIVVADLAFRDGADEAMIDALFSGLDELPRLLAYSAWDRASSTLATSLAHAAVRLIALQDKGAFDLAQLIVDLTPMRYLALLDTLIESEKAHIELLFSRFVEDWLYHVRVRPEVENHVVKMVRDSLVDLREIGDRAEQMVQDLLAGVAADLWIEQFLGRKCVEIGMHPHRSELVLAELEETRSRLPWRRLAEVEVEVEFGVELVAQQ